jgi:plastocyanin
MMKPSASTASAIRSAAVAATLGAATAVGLAAVVLPGWADTAPPAPITIDNFVFTPPKLTVKAGTTITWTNHDDIPHGIASASNAFKRSQALDTDDSYSFTFTTPGTYQYFCYLHPHMVGSIVVEAGGNATQ